MFKKVILFCVFILSLTEVSADFQLDNWAEKVVERFELSKYNLDEQITRKEFVESLYAWYKDYRTERWLYVDYENYNQIDNVIYFKDIDLNSDFWEKLEYFVYLEAFSKNEYFSPNEKVDQKVFFIVMNRLKIMSSLQQCKNLRICEREADEKTYFSKGVYYRYLSKIFDKSLRTYYSNPQDYIDAGYEPFLKPSYYFPNAGQTLNGCYAFTIRNILKYKHGIWVYIPKVEEYIWKEWTQLWYNDLMNKYDEEVHVTRRSYYNIDTFMNAMQVWEPVSVSYKLKYYSYKDQEYKYVSHIVAAYSFDSEGVWVSETVKNQRMRIAWDELFTQYGNVKLNRIFKYDYQFYEDWSEEEKQKEKENNFLAWEK